MRTVCKLGAFVFPIAPEREVKVQDSQTLAKIDIPGAPPRYQDMGKEEKIISWSGILVGAQAFSQTQQIQTSMQRGEQLHFVYGDLNTYVRIRKFEKRIRHFGENARIRYDIELVEERPTTPPKNAVKSNVIQTNQKPAGQATKTSTSQKTAKKTVKIKQGQTLSELAKIYYGDANKWPVIAKANGITNPRKVPVGKALVIP